MRKTSATTISLTQRPAKWLVSKLSYLELKSKYAVKDREELIERIQESLKKIADNEMLVPFDVKAIS